MSADPRFRLFKTFNDSVKEVLIDFLVSPETSMMDIGSHNEEICPALMNSGLKRYSFVEKNYTNQNERREAWNKVMAAYKHSSGDHRKTIDVVDMLPTDLIAESLPPGTKEKYNYVACFDGFQLMYGFNDKERITTLVRNVAEALVPGGIFFGSVIDSSIIFSAVDRSSGRAIMATEMYRIELNASSFREFGTGAEITLNESGVFFGSLVHFPTLINICREYGLKMLDIQNFEEFYIDYKDSVDKKLASRGCRVHMDQLKPFRLYTTFVFQKL